jgi:Xaa-Pro aminopeptidase
MNARVLLTASVIRSIEEAQSLIKKLQPRECTLVPVSENLVDIVWGSERPARPATEVIPLDIKYAG